MQDWKQVREAISDASIINIFTHIHADGDCLGSAFALAYFLCDSGKRVNIISEENPPENLSFIYKKDLPGTMKFYVWDDIKNNDNTELECDLSVAVDVSDVKRLGDRGELFYKAPVKVRIDHHLATETFAEITVCNPSWAATAEGIWELIKTYDGFKDLPHLTEIAKSVYTGILTDTGCFAYSNVTADTHMIASEILSLTGSLSWIYSAIYENISKNEIALKAKAYNKVEYYADGSIAFLQITKEDMTETGTDDESLSGLAPFLRTIEGVSVGILVKPGKFLGQCRISLRSDERCDVNAVATTFGGGGHKRAAGVVFSSENGMSFEGYKEKLIGEVQKWMV